VSENVHELVILMYDTIHGLLSLETKAASETEGINAVNSDVIETVKDYIHDSSDNHLFVIGDSINLQAIYYLLAI
jgi:hypothetical protein